MTNLFDIKGNVTVITGGTGVLGRAIARYLALNGAYVIILGRKESTGAEIVADTREAIAAEKASGSIEFLKTDVMEREVLENNLQYIIENYGRVDTLLNAAGGNMPGAVINPDKTFFDLDPSQFRRVLDLNLTGTVIPTQVFLKPMVEQSKGVIINFSSMAAFRPLTRVCGYAAAKAGISNFTAYLATECAKKIRRRDTRQCDSAGILHHRAEPVATYQSRRKLYRARTRRYTPDTIRAHGRS